MDDWEKTSDTLKAAQFRDAADQARHCDDMLSRMNKARPPKQMLMGFDLDFLADEFDNHADELEGKESE